MRYRAPLAHPDLDEYGKTVRRELQKVFILSTDFFFPERESREKCRSPANVA